MLTDSDIVPQCLVRPASFGALMALYEGNFIKLSRLVPRLERRCGAYLSSPGRDCNLQLRIEEQSRYTRIIRLSYLFREPSGVVADPDLRLRVYLDARMAEVRSWAGQPRHAVLRDLNRQFHRELDRRWSGNMILSKWLDYLLDMGHELRPLRRPIDGCAHSAAG